MINIRAMSFNGEPLLQAPSCVFDERGGTLGRAETNHLVLPDPDRHVSRVQARVTWKDDHFELINIGANALDLGGRRIVNGSATTIRPGDQIVVGGYVLEVCPASERSAGSAKGALVREPDLSPVPVNDRLGPFAAGGEDVSLSGHSRALTDSFNAAPEGGTTGSPSKPSGSDRGSGVVASAGGIPNDFDPFAAPPAPPPPPAWSEAGSVDELGFGREGEALAGSNINDLFSLDPAASVGAAGADLFAGTPLADSPNGSGVGSAVDPLAAFCGMPPPAPVDAPVADQAPEIRGAFSPSAPVIRGDAFFSWDNSTAKEQADLTAIRSTSEDEPDGSGAATEPPRVQEPKPMPVETGWHVSKPVETPANANKVGGEVKRAGESGECPSGRVMDARGMDSLTRAFLSGLGVPDLPLPGEMTPELLERIGMLLRESTQGTLDLLLARATTKREVRAEMTMIVSQENNPLKFSPNVEIALTHLLAPSGRGFMQPVEAMRDAYQDLRAHELGFIAGMRAALAGVLRRFDPAVLEQRLNDRSLLDSLLSTSRRARLWNQYTELYRDIASEAEDGFHTLFGREFLRAYEEQVRHRERRDA